MVPSKLDPDVLLLILLTLSGLLVVTGVGALCGWPWALIASGVLLAVLTWLFYRD